MRQGLISPAEREAISSINGHSSRISKDHYERQNQIGNVHLVRKALQRTEVVAHQQEQLLTPESRQDAGHRVLLQAPAATHQVGRHVQSEEWDVGKQSGVRSFDETHILILILIKQIP